MNTIQKVIEEGNKKFKNSKFAKGGGSCFECCDFEEMYLELEKNRKDDTSKLLSAVEKDKRELLWDYSNWLHKKNYIDTDYYTEEPFAVDEYLKEKK